MPGVGAPAVLVKIRLARSGIDLALDVAGAGPPLILLHGFALDRHIWREVAADLAANFNVVRYDLRGHGETTAPKDSEQYSEDALVSDLEDLMDALGFERAYVGGLSMGGNIALRYSMAAPTRLLGLALISVGSGSDDIVLSRQNALELAELIEQGHVATFKDRVLRSSWLSHYANSSEAARERLIATIGRNDPTALAHILRGVLARRPSIDELLPLMRIDGPPTLALLGSLDLPCRRAMRLIANRLSARLEDVPSSGHLAPLEQPAFVSSALRAFHARCVNCLSDWNSSREVEQRD